MEVRYFINEKNIKSTFGVYVAASEGVLDLPKIKDFTKQDWYEYHGTIVDLAPPKLQNREITLDCWITAANQLAFVQKINALYQEFLKSGYKRLRVEIGDDVPPLIFDTYLADSIKITKKWSPGSQQGKFKIKLSEPNPQKRIFKFIASGRKLTCTLQIKTDMAATITWGDNTRTDEVIAGSWYHVSHIYSRAGEYYISISGMITNLDTSYNHENTQLIWQML